MFILAENQGSPSFLPIVVYMVAIFAIVYFLLLRPQRRKEKDRLAMLQNVRKNDRVVTSGGIYGVVTAVGKDEITLKVDETNNVRMRFAVNAITGIIRQSEKKEDA